MTYAVNPAYGIGFPKDGYGVRAMAEALGWRIPVLAILVVIVIPFVGDLSDKIGRRSGPRAWSSPRSVPASVSLALILYAISIKNIPLAIANWRGCMWGVVWVELRP